jgi:hypothetical protein
MSVSASAGKSAVLISFKEIKLENAKLAPELCGWACVFRFDTPEEANEAVPAMRTAALIMCCIKFDMKVSYQI